MWFKAIVGPTLYRIYQLGSEPVGQSGAKYTDLCSACMSGYCGWAEFGILVCENRSRLMEDDCLYFCLFLNSLCLILILY